MRIDFLGAHGGGKTTLYRALLRGRGRVPGRVLGAWEACGAIAVQRVRRRWPLLGWGLGLAQAIGPYELRKGVISRINQPCAQAAMHRMGYRWRPFVRFCLDSLGDDDSRDPLRHATELRQFFAALEQAALLHAHAPAESLVLWDESLSHRVHNVGFWHGSLLAFAQRYFELLPRPDGLIHVRADPAEAARRLASRHPVQGLYRQFDAPLLAERVKDAAQVAEVGAQVLRSRGVAVLDVAAEASLSRRVEEARAFLAECGVPVVPSAPCPEVAG